MSSKKVEEFLREIVALSKRYGLSLSHEDSHGAFQVEDYDELYDRWLLAATDETKKEEDASYRRARL